jgi:hypothetical protein
VQFKNFSQYLKENTTLLHYKDQSRNAVYSEDRKYSLWGTAELLIIKAGGTYSYHWSLRDY